METVLVPHNDMETVLVAHNDMETVLVAHNDMKTELYRTNAKSCGGIYKASFQHKLHQFMHVVQY